VKADSGGAGGGAARRLARLRCPGCRGALELRTLEEDARGACSEGLFTCGACASWFPVTAGVPRLLLPGPLRPDLAAFQERWRERLPALAARDAPRSEARNGQAQVQDAFAHKWTRQPWWGLEGESARVISEWLLARYGWAGADEYRRFLAGRGQILDAGAGLGRETVRMAEAAPAADVFGLELSACVDESAAHARTRGLDNVLFVQADLMAPPFAPASFDFVLSEGVLHHTPDTRAAFLSLASLLAPAGEIGFYVYRKKAALREFADDHVRRLVQDLPPDEAWARMEPLTRLGRALAALKAEVEVPDDVPELGIRAGRYDVQRLVYYAMFKCYWNDRLTVAENVHVNFEWSYPRFA
jgi:SAM-dependent methyltransferase/uncharacterized protein YbaR (Trm112 family)